MTMLCTPSPPVASQGNTRTTIGIFSHYAGLWSANEKFRVGTGAGKDHWRVANDQELSRLTSDDPPGAGSRVTVFTFPNHLRNTFWELDFSSGLEETVMTPGYRTFAARVLDYLEFIGVPIDATCTVRTEISQPGNAPNWNEAARSTGYESPPTAILNFGSEPRAVLWPTAEQSCPWARLSLAPGEACFGPLRQILLRQDTSDMTDLDINVIVEPAAPEAIGGP